MAYSDGGLLGAQSFGVGSALEAFSGQTSLIGVCASETMRCQITKVWGIGSAAVVFAASLINLLSGKEGQVPG